MMQKVRLIIIIKLNFKFNNLFQYFFKISYKKLISKFLHSTLINYRLLYIFVDIKVKF